STPVQSKAETTSLTSDEEYSLPTGYPEATIYIHMPPAYEDVVNSCADSPPLDYSDPEPYFDCNQAGSDFSETEHETSTSAKGDQPKDHYIHPRVLKKADEMPEFPSQSVMEETYKDENGHTVVKKVTRKIIRKCVSADGLEHEEVSSEGAPQESISMAEGDGYSKVVKRTVLKSEGDQTEVCVM
ncbi:hypothetical protein JOQ06_012934, partial [Pogonophryne albipinna]